MRSVTDLNLEGKFVFLRVDLNVPLRDGVIQDANRINAVLPTLNHLLERGARVVCASHLGRPKGKVVPGLSLKPVSELLADLIDYRVIQAPSVAGSEVDHLKTTLRPSEVLLLENLRFRPEEKSNDPGFAADLAGNIDCYVNDAFAACHRAHASVVGIPALVRESAAGFLIEKELSFLRRAVFSPERPYVAILGGAKVSDKIPVIRNLLKKADTLLIGGAMAYTFLSALGMGVGRSLVEQDKKELALELLSMAEDLDTRIILPLDHVCAPSIEGTGEAGVYRDSPLPDDMMGLDIGPATIEEFSRFIREAGMILWNGPMGVFEVDRFSRGTVKVAEAVAASSAVSIVGGGDSVAALSKAGVSGRISHISTGGGASLEYIANGTLPGLEALNGKEG